MISLAKPGRGRGGAFVPLRVRSHGSLLRGTASPAALIGRALELGYGALALTDRDNLYLAVSFYRAARAEGLAPLLGAEMTPPPGESAGGALLVALDRRGYANLCALLTARHLEPRFDLARALAETHDGLHVVVESPGLAAALVTAGVPPACGAGWSAGRERTRGPGGLWMGVRGLPRERGALRERLATARHLGLPLVATGDVVMLGPDDWETHRVAVTAAAGELLERMPPAAFAARAAWLAGPEEWARRVRAVCAGASAPEAAEEALANNRILASRCRLEIEMGVPIFPKTPHPARDGGEPEPGPVWLRRLAEAGLARRYGRGARAARARLAEELGLIERLGFTDYFLLVAEIVEFARARGIPSVGRGSGASSMVAYVLGITNVDPLRHGLCFERFLHPRRRDCPDLDIDLCWQRRDEVIAHVYETYGRDRVAMIATHATLGARSAFRETAKALGVANARVNALAKRIPRQLEAPYLDRLLALPEARAIDWREPPLAQALALAERLDGAPRHLSVHCGGVVVADRPLTWYVPLERAAKDVVVTQFEMRAIEQIGLVKMDLLGNRALSTIGECVRLARRRFPPAPEGAPLPAALAVERLAEDEPATAARVAAGDTLNCFQLESPAMRHLLRMLGARTLEETIAAVALVRPGPAESGMKQAYCRRHRGLEPDTFHHERLVPVLGATHGVMLYEEDVMRVAAALAGLSLAEGDDLRRAIGAARADEEFRALERGFVAQAARQGVGPETARAVWADLARFAAYAFCKAHAAGYGALGWQSAYLKTHFPVEWAVGILNHHAGMYATWVHVEDLRRQGVTFLAPCVNHSAWETTLEEPEGDGWLRAGDRARGSGGEGSRVGRLGRGEVPRGRPEASGAREPDRREGSAERAEEERAGTGWWRRACPRSLSPSRPSPAASRTSCSWGPSSVGPSPVAWPEPAGSVPPVPRDGMVRVGLGRVFGLASATGERIVAARGERPFRTLADFADRVRPTLPELESLILAGALDFTGRTRPSLLLEARVGAAPAHHTAAPARAPALVAPDGALLAPEPVSPVAVPDLPEFDPAERVRGECRATGLWFSAHPLDVLVSPEAWRGAVPAREVAAHAGRRITLAGLPCAYRRVETKSGAQMLFLTLADRTGLAECVLFPGVLRALAPAVRGQVVRVEGRAEETLDAVTIRVERATALA